LRVIWKGSYFNPKVNFYKNIESLGNRQIIVNDEFIGETFILYKGNAFEKFQCRVEHCGMLCAAFVFTKKYKNIHLNNRPQRKRMLRKMQLQNKSKARKLGLLKKKKFFIKKKINKNKKNLK